MITGRFAPTPSGGLHLGNLFSALLCWLSARSAGGSVLMRIEDIDIERTRREYAEEAMRDISLLGMDWDGEVLYQSTRNDFYREAMEKLEKMGLIYPCFCSRAELHVLSAPHESDGEYVYSGKCKSLTPEEIAERSKKRSPAMRVSVPDETVTFTDEHYGEVSQNLKKDCGDFILRRSDGNFGYQLAVVADDGDTGVTQVVRGRDLMSSAPRQIYLFRLLGYEPPSFAHTPLLLAHDGRRLSKRDRDDSLSGILDKGLTPEDVVGRLAFMAGLIDRPEPAKASELIPLFSWDKVPKEDIYIPKDLFVDRAR